MSKVPAGYKQTEVGVIPEDWSAEPAGDLVESSSPICYGVVQVGQNTDNGIPIVAIKFVKEIAYAQLHRTAVNLEKPYTRSRVKAGDVLISIKGTIGRVGVVPEGFEGNISRELARLRLSKNFSPAYVAQQLESGVTQERISRAVVGTTRLEFSITTLRQFELPIPPTLAEQEAIAEALSDTDALIESLEQLIAKKHHLKQGAMQELLTGKKRLPGFAPVGAGFKPALTNVPDGWEVKRLGDMTSLYQPLTIAAHQFTAAGYPVYGANGIVGFFNKFNHELWQVTVTCRGSTCGTVNRTMGKCWITGNAMVINCDDSKKVDKTFLYYLLSFQDLSVCITGTGQPQIVRTPLANYELNVPIEKPEQTAIAAILSDMDAEIAALETKLTKTRQLKQGMMHNLLTGRIRLL